MDGCPGLVDPPENGAVHGVLTGASWLSCARTKRNDLAYSSSQSPQASNSPSRSSGNRGQVVP